ncbi:T9SS type A sorting domain-containing protein [Chryseobacterium camelliae]|uniref:T9SS type A sorting domain-containing protein n=1 Tax=Chryseobacterium camelliae TaxID=1265445 RepID=A0ABY7QMC6_9FLAO|nr:T9SS type A sorting domain-containing protein [Chryseobacterium camelliae]WBV60787.1 T9SS type A sorting domain-containing protein [Chryseobacterium camelliae]
MKKTLFLLLCSVFLSAQNSELFTNDWYISQIVTNGQTVTTPSMAYAVSPSLFTQNNSNYYFASKYFNTAQINITFSAATSSFTKIGGGCTLADYWGVNTTAVQQYDQKNCDFYISNALPGTTYNYQILANGTSKTLIVTNPNSGTQIFYNNAFLGTKENTLKKTFTIYPNPVNDFLIVENLERNLKVKIYDMSGKLLFETLSSGKALRVNTTDFQKGQYILSVENFKPELFLKK